MRATSLRAPSKGFFKGWHAMSLLCCCGCFCFCSSVCFTLHVCVLWESNGARTSDNPVLARWRLSSNLRDSEANILMEWTAALLGVCSAASGWKVRVSGEARQAQQSIWAQIWRISYVCYAYSSYSSRIQRERESAQSIGGYGWWCFGWIPRWYILFRAILPAVLGASRFVPGITV